MVKCEQYHSEIKSDMDFERLSSGKFVANALVLEIGMIAYNILRMIGQGTIGGRAPHQKREVKRRRIRTVIGNMIMMVSHVTSHDRQLIMGLGKSNVWPHIFTRALELKESYWFKEALIEWYDYSNKTNAMSLLEKTD